MSSVLATVRPVPTLVTIGNKTVNVTGSWNALMVIQHLKDHLADLSPRKKWCTVECMAKTMFLRNSEDNRGRVRKAVAPTFKKLLKLGMFLAIEYNGSHRAITAMKIYEESGGANEQKAAEEQLNRMRARGEVSAMAWGHARQLVSLLPAAPNAMEP